jgi:hypothetical protein
LKSAKPGADRLRSPVSSLMTHAIPNFIYHDEVTVRHCAGEAFEVAMIEIFAGERLIKRLRNEPVTSTHHPSITLDSTCFDHSAFCIFVNDHHSQVRVAAKCREEKAKVLSTKLLG